MKREKKAWGVRDFALVSFLLAVVAFFMFVLAFEAQGNGDNATVGFLLGATSTLGAIAAGLVAAIGRGNQLGRD